MEANRNALEKAGMYVESIIEVKDFQLTRDDIKTYTAGIIEVTETDEPKWEMSGQTLRVTVKVKARIDKDDVAKRIAALHQDKEATQQLSQWGAKAMATKGLSVKDILAFYYHGAEITALLQ